MPKRTLLTAILAAGFLMGGCGEQSTDESKQGATTRIDGTWSAELDNGEEYRLEITSRAGRLSGFVTTPGGDRRPLNEGSIEGDVFEFSTQQGKDVWIWEGEVMDDGLDGIRRTPDAETGISFLADPADAE